jgi:diaminohydroxyphosphoribosylaminopyrimidine deaminase/5-amino-6-(5-phosphoribosylamino)uracil reductase
VDSSPERSASLTRAGAEILVVDTDSTVEPALQCLAARGVCSMIVEGGVTLHRAFWDADVVDRVQRYMTPQLLGVDGLEWLPFPLTGLGRVSERPLGADRLDEADVHRID